VVASDGIIVVLLWRGGGVQAEAVRIMLVDPEVGGEEKSGIAQ
jgi:hypothetical protein